MLLSTGTFPVRYLIFASLCRKGTELWVVLYRWHEIDFSPSIEISFFKSQTKALID